MTDIDQDKLDRLVASARQAGDAREQGYREQALKLFPHVCGRCGRVFDRHHLHELTVHHRDHNHDYNPADGSNWELLCLYCHDNEHQRLLEAQPSQQSNAAASPRDARYQPFAGLKDRLDKGRD